MQADLTLPVEFKKSFFSNYNQFWFRRLASNRKQINKCNCIYIYIMNDLLSNENIYTYERRALLYRRFMHTNKGGEARNKFNN